MKIRKLASSLCLTLILTLSVLNFSLISINGVDPKPVRPTDPITPKFFSQYL